MSSQPAYAGFKLKSTGHADIIKAGGDVGKSIPAVPSSPPSSPPPAPVVPFESSSSNATKSESTTVTPAAALRHQKASTEQDQLNPKEAQDSSSDAMQQKQRCTEQVEQPTQPSSPKGPAWAAGNMKLKATAKGDAVKSGKEIHYQAFKPKPFEDMTPEEREKAMRRRAKRKAKAEARAAKLAAEAESKPTLEQKDATNIDDNQVADVTDESEHNQEEAPTPEMNSISQRNHPSNYSIKSDTKPSSEPQVKAAQEPSQPQPQPQKESSEAEQLQSSAVLTESTNNRKIELEPPKPKNKNKAYQSQKPAYAGFKLKSTGQAATILAGGDVTNEKTVEMEVKVNSQSLISLKSTGQLEALEAAPEATKTAALAPTQTVENAMLSHPTTTGHMQQEQQTLELPKKTEQAEQNLSSSKGHSPTKVTAVPKPAPAYAGFKLKSTGQADRIKAGGDVVKEAQPILKDKSANACSIGLQKAGSKDNNENLEEEKKRGGIPCESSSTVLKDRSPNKASIVGLAAPPNHSISNGCCPEVPLMQENIEPTVSSNNTHKNRPQNDSIVGLVLKKTGSTETAAMEKEMPQTVNSELKSPKKEAQPEQATSTGKPAYAGFKLKSTGYGDAVMSGGDVEAPKKSFESSNEYGKVHLKKVGAIH